MTKSCARCGGEFTRAVMENDHNWQIHTFCSEACRLIHARQRRAQTTASAGRLGAFYARGSWRYSAPDCVHEYSALDRLLDVHSPGWRERGGDIARRAA